MEDIRFFGEKPDIKKVGRVISSLTNKKTLTPREQKKLEQYRAYEAEYEEITYKLTTSEWIDENDPETRQCLEMVRKIMAENPDPVRELTRKERILFKIHYFFLPVHTRLLSVQLWWLSLREAVVEWTRRIIDQIRGS
jgi:hypothetical protein